MLNIAHQGNTSQISMRYHLTLVRMAKLTTQGRTGVGEDEEKGEPSCTTSGNARRAEGCRTTGGRVVEPWTTERSLAGNKGAHQCHLPHPSPSQNPKGNQFLSGNLPAPHKHPTLLLRIHPSGRSDYLRVPQPLLKQSFGLAS